MIDRLVKLEQDRLATIGYQSIVTPVELVVTKPTECFIISNDTYLLSGIRVSQSDLVGTDSRIQIISPTGVISGTARQISTLGTSTNVLFKQNIVVKVCNADGEFLPDASVMPFSLFFIKISPQKK